MYIKQIDANVFITNDGINVLDADEATLNAHPSITENPLMFSIVSELPEKHDLLLYSTA